MAKGKSTSKPEPLHTPPSLQYAKRTSKGRFQEMGDVGRSHSADRRRKAKKTVKAGYGDSGRSATHA